MSENLRNIIHENNLLDKRDASLSEEQVYFHLERTLGEHTARIERLANLKAEQREKLKIDIKMFLIGSLRNSLHSPTKIDGREVNTLWEYNAASFDTNREKGLDRYEFGRYFNNIEQAIRLIIELGWVDKMKKELSGIQRETTESPTMNMDLLGDKHDKSPMTKKFTEWYQKNLSNLSPTQIQELTHTQLWWDKTKFIQGLSIALGTEFWVEAVEIALNFFYDLSKAALQLPEYLYFAFRYNKATTELDKKEYGMKMKSRLDDNMVLWLLALSYDGVADITTNLLWGNTSADPKGSRARELIHGIWRPETWTPAWIKDAIIWLLPFLKLSRRWGGARVNPEQKIVTTGVLPQESVRRANHWEVSKTNPKTAYLQKKLTTPEINTVKERQLQDGKTIKFSPEEYLESYNEWLEKVGDLMKWTRDWVLMSSNAMYVKIPRYKVLPDDFDVVIRDRDFGWVYSKLQQAQGTWKIQNLSIHSIDKTHLKHIEDPILQKKLLSDWNLKITFDIQTRNKIPMEVEMFPEGKWKWLTQIWSIPRTVESFFLNGKEIKVSWVLDLSDTYTINLMNELLKNSVDKFWEKAKDSTRIYNLTYYLKNTWISKPRDLLAKMDEVVKKYQKHGWDDLSKWLEGIFARLPEVKEILSKIIEEYELNQEFNHKQKWRLPDFQEFTESWNKNKIDLYKIYLEVKETKQMGPERRREIKNTLEEYGDQVKNVMKISLNNEDFAYFYEASIIKEKFINEIYRNMN